MKIGFDAKRAFQNTTGLGHYSRNLVRSLSDIFPEHSYYLFAPKQTPLFDTSGRKNIQVITPSGFPSTLFRSAWRSSWVKKDLLRLGIELYHGLSHEIPLGMPKTGIPSVVTIHDLIHERFPEQYNGLDVKIYQQKTRYACRHANHIIAVSDHTKKDIIEFYGIPGEKISVCYQGCNPAFANRVSDEEKMRAKRLYGLPDEYFLYVGSIIERKNLLSLCRAMKELKDRCPVPLVVIGEGGAYKQAVKEYLNRNGLRDKVIFLSEQENMKKISGFYTAEDFPAIFQQAICMIYPSRYEGFGIPVLESLFSGVPVITTNLSSLPEVAGDTAYYVDPDDAAQLAKAMIEVKENATLRERMIETGRRHAQRFLPKYGAASVMDVYNRLLKGCAQKIGQGSLMMLLQCCMFL